MKALFALMLLATLSSHAFAATVVGQVARIYPSQLDNGTTVVSFRIKGDDCKSPSAGVNTYWRFELKNEVSKAWYAMLLTAASTGKTVKLSAPTCDASINEYISYLYQDF